MAFLQGSSVAALAALRSDIARPMLPVTISRLSSVVAVAVQLAVVQVASAVLVVLEVLSAIVVVVLPVPAVLPVPVSPKHFAVSAV